MRKAKMTPAQEKLLVQLALAVVDISEVTFPVKKQIAKLFDEMQAQSIAETLEG